MFEEVWCDFEQPLRLDLNYIAHELLCREHQLIIDDPLGLIFEETGIGVHVNYLGGVRLAFQQTVCARFFLKLRCIVEEPRRYSFP